MNSVTLLAIDGLLKLALAGLLGFAVVRRDLARFSGKAMRARAVAYPLAVALLPAGWLIGGDGTYPVAADILFTLPFLIDTAGNAWDLYDRIGHWDDANHFVNWALLCAGLGQLLAGASLDRLVAAGLVVGFGAVAAILWELAEYVTFIRFSPELATAYTDTLGDLGLGLTGSACAALLTVTALWPT